MENGSSIKDNSTHKGVIDLGTNTFHLLIVSISADGSVKEVHRERIFVLLGEGGVHQIGEGAFQRGLEALERFAKILNDFGVTDFKAVGTAALRRSTNAQVFIQEVKTKTGIPIEIIIGQDEADFIHKGVAQSLSPDFGSYLIMDIGGGSTEFIFNGKNQNNWMKSFPVGLSVLHHAYHHHEPISTSESEILRNFLSRTLSELAEASKKFEFTRLIGASGTFDVLSSLMGIPIENSRCTSVNCSDFMAYAHKVRLMNYDQRLQEPSIPKERARMMVVAFELLQTVLEACPQITEIVVSPFALKEGILATMTPDLQLKW